MHQPPLTFPNPWLTPESEESLRRWYGKEYDREIERIRAMPPKVCPTCGAMAYLKPSISVYVCPICHGLGVPESGWYHSRR